MLGPGRAESTLQTINISVISADHKTFLLQGRGERRTKQRCCWGQTGQHALQQINSSFISCNLT